MSHRRPKLDQLWYEQAAERRDHALKTGVGKRLEAKRFATKRDEEHPSCKYKNWQCTGVRASLEANKRVPSRGLGWKRIGQLWGVPYQTVRKLAQLAPQPNGTMYRPSCFPEEANILAQVEQLTRLHAETQRIRNERRVTRAKTITAVANAESMAEGTAISKRLDVSERFYELCREIGIRKPETPAELNSATEAISKHYGDKIDLVTLSEAMEAVASTIK